MIRARSETLEQHTARVMADWPPLTREQADTVAVLLRAGGGDQ